MDFKNIKYIRLLVYEGQYAQSDNMPGNVGAQILSLPTTFSKCDPKGIPKWKHHPESIPDFSKQHPKIYPNCWKTYPKVLPKIRENHTRMSGIYVPTPYMEYMEEPPPGIGLP